MIKYDINIRLKTYFVNSNFLSFWYFLLSYSNCTIIYLLSYDQVQFWCFFTINVWYYLFKKIDKLKITHIFYSIQTRETVFHYIASEGNVDVLKEVLTHLHGGQIQLAVNKQSSKGWSPLIVAASKGHLEVTRVSKNRWISDRN